MFNLIEALYRRVTRLGAQLINLGERMARLVFGMNQSLDGYVDHTAFAPTPQLFRHFIEEAEGQAGSLYGAKCTR